MENGGIILTKMNKTPEQLFKENYCCQFIDDGMADYRLCGCIYKYNIKRNQWRLKVECEIHKEITLRANAMRYLLNG